MGQHKHNQTAIAAKMGKIKPKEKVMTKAQLKRAYDKYLNSLGFLPVLPHTFGTYDSKESE